MPPIWKVKYLGKTKNRYLFRKTTPIGEYVRRKLNAVFNFQNIETMEMRWFVKKFKIEFMEFQGSTNLIEKRIEQFSSSLLSEYDEKNLNSEYFSVYVLTDNKSLNKLKVVQIWVTQNISNKYFDFMQNQGLTYEFLLLLLLKITHIYICNFFRLLDLGNLWCRVRIPNNLNFSLIWSTTQYKQKQIVCSGKRLQNKSLVPYITLFW